MLTVTGVLTIVFIWKVAGSVAWPVIYQPPSTHWWLPLVLGDGAAQPLHCQAVLMISNPAQPSQALSAHCNSQVTRCFWLRETQETNGVSGSIKINVDWGGEWEEILWTLYAHIIVYQDSEASNLNKDIDLNIFSDISVPSWQLGNCNFLTNSFCLGLNSCHQMGIVENHCQRKIHHQSSWGGSGHILHLQPRAQLTERMLRHGRWMPCQLTWTTNWNRN